jgi:hypothetical protein
MLENKNEVRTHRTGGMTGNRSKDVHLYEFWPRKDHRGVDLISDALPFGRLWYGEPDAISSLRRHIAIALYCIRALFSF